MTFRAPADGVLRAVRLDAMTAIYDRRSGMTHLVAEVVPTILTALGEGDADIEALAMRLFGSDATADRLPEPVEGLSFSDVEEGQPLNKLRDAECFTGADRTALAERLDELADIGLVERL